MEIGFLAAALIMWAVAASTEDYFNPLWSWFSYLAAAGFGTLGIATHVGWIF